MRRATARTDAKPREGRLFWSVSGAGTARLGCGPAGCCACATTAAANITTSTHPSAITQRIYKHRSAPLTCHSY